MDTNDNAFRLSNMVSVYFCTVEAPTAAEILDITARVGRAFSFDSATVDSAAQLVMKRRGVEAPAPVVEAPKPAAVPAPVEPEPKAATVRGGVVPGVGIHSLLARLRRFAEKHAGPWEVSKQGKKVYAGGAIVRHSRGIHFNRVGCSETVAVHWSAGPEAYAKGEQWVRNNEREEGKRQTQAFLAAARAAGFPFDDRGFIDAEFNY